MNIVIDIRPLMEGKISGVEVYIHNILRELFIIDHKNSYILFANAAQDVSAFLPKIHQKNVTVIQTRIPNKLLNLSLCFLRRPNLDKIILKYLKRHPEKIPPTMRERKIDLFFMPDLRPSKLHRSVKKITVIHDLSFHHYKKYFSAKTRMWYKILHPKREIKTSHHLIAVSAFTKNDLIKTFHVPEEKIHVIYEGVEAGFGENLSQTGLEKVKVRYKLPPRYFLFLSTIEPRKNIQNIIRGFIIYKRLNPEDNVMLVIAGSKNDKIFSKVEYEKHPDIVFTGFIDEEDKAAVIKQAEVFLYPSFFEGFGLPLVEAMKCGTPIITSNVSAMPEIVGDAAILINPEFADSISIALEKIQKPEIRSALQQKMEMQVKKFSWQKCARETLQLFQSTL